MSPVVLAPPQVGEPLLAGFQSFESGGLKGTMRQNHRIIDEERLSLFLPIKSGIVTDDIGPYSPSHSPPACR